MQGERKESVAPVLVQRFDWLQAASTKTTPHTSDTPSPIRRLMEVVCTRRQLVVSGCVKTSSQLFVRVWNALDVNLDLRMCQFD